MKFRNLGKTKLKVSAIGFGAWGIGGVTPGPTSYGHQVDDTSLQTLDYALDSGITFFDTSSVYGYGHSEELIGRAFEHKRDQVVIATKAGLERYDEAPDFSPSYLIESVESSLMRLRTDYIDLLMLHNPPQESEIDGDTIANLADDLKNQGKIRAFGVSLRSPLDGAAYIEKLGVDALQTNFNLLDQRAIDCGLMELVRQEKVSLIARTPLCFGFLSGKITEDTSFDDQDHRSRWPKEQIFDWLRGASAIGACMDKSNGQTPVQFALRFCMSFPEITSTIPGMLSPDEVRDNVAASGLGLLTAEELNDVRGVYKELNAKSEQNFKNRNGDLGRVN